MTDMDLLCDAPGCNKVFSRKDHLKRHKANHSEATYHCPGTNCGKSFRRPDLLQRHERRGLCDASPGAVHENGLQQQDHAGSQDESSPELERDNTGGRKRGVSQLLADQRSPEAGPSNYASYASHSMQSAHNQLPTSTQPETSDSPFWNLINSFQVQPQPDVDLWDQFRSQNLAQPVNQPEAEHWDWYPFQGTDAFGAWGGMGGMGASPEVPSMFPFATDNAAPMWAESSADAQRRFMLEPEAAATAHSDFNDVQYQEHVNKRARTSSAREESDLGVSLALPDLDVDQLLLLRLVSAFPTHLDLTQYTLHLLRESLQSYWHNIAPGLPFIHRGSFNHATASAPLLLLMSVVGCADLSTDVFPALAFLRIKFRELVRRIRGDLVAEMTLAMPITSVQTFCLCHIHDMWLSTAEAQLAAQCTWSIMVVHSRRKGIGTGVKVDDGEEDTAAAFETRSWRKWAKDEERRRSAFYICQLDTQLSGFFNQHPSRSLSIFAHRIMLPCGADEWNAKTPEEWRAAQVRHTVDDPSPCPHVSKLASDGLSPKTTKPAPVKPVPTPFLPGIHPEFKVQRAGEGWSTCIQAALSLSNDEPLPFPAGCPTYAYNAELILTGLLAVAWDCRVRGGIGIRIWDGSNNLKNWKLNVLRSILKLRYTVEHGHGEPNSPSRVNLRDSFALAIISVLSDIPMMQIVAGATDICGSIIGPREYSDAKRRHKLWAKSSDARTCVSLCAKYLQEVLGASSGLYTTWAIYLATLVVWSYGNSVHGALERTSNPPSVEVYLDTIVCAPSVDTLADIKELQQSQNLLLSSARCIGDRTPVDEEHSNLLMRRVAKHSTP